MMILVYPIYPLSPVLSRIARTVSLHVCGGEAVLAGVEKPEQHRHPPWAKGPLVSGCLAWCMLSLSRLCPLQIVIFHSNSLNGYLGVIIYQGITLPVVPATTTLALPDFPL